MKKARLVFVALAATALMGGGFMASKVVAGDGLKHHWYQVRGREIFSFDPDVAGSQAAAKDRCEKYAKARNTTCTGPYKGSALPAW